MLQKNIREVVRRMGGWWSGREISLFLESLEENHRVAHFRLQELSANTHVVRLNFLMHKVSKRNTWSSSPNAVSTRSKIISYSRTTCKRWRAIRVLTFVSFILTFPNVTKKIHKAMKRVIVWLATATNQTTELSAFSFRTFMLCDRYRAEAIRFSLQRNLGREIFDRNSR